jgi:hypothetical protein
MVTIYLATGQSFQVPNTEAAHVDKFPNSTVTALVCGVLQAHRDSRLQRGAGAPRVDGAGLAAPHGDRGRAAVSVSCQTGSEPKVPNKTLAGGRSSRSGCNPG